MELLSKPTKGSIPPPVEVRTIDPDESPAVKGVVALTRTVSLWPGARNSTCGETDANGTNFSVDTCHGMAPLVPPAEATSPKMTPVQVPPSGCRTSTLPKLPTPCGTSGRRTGPPGR